MSEYYFQEFEDYVEQLCREHVDIQHELNDVVGFSRLRSQTEVNSLVNNAGKNVVLMGRFSGNAIGETDDDRMRQIAVLRFACYADPGSNNVDVAIDKAWDIMMQFMARLKKDRVDDDCGPLRNLEPESMSWDEIDEPIFLENHYGWDLTIPFRSTMPAYDATKWTTIP